MSALGQKQTFAVQKAMSALPPKADMCSATSRCPLCANSGHSSVIALIVILACFQHQVDACGQRADRPPNGIH